jgi:hypothetical protein
MSRPSGSEHRQRTALVGVRLLPDEYQRLIDHAAAHGVTAPAVLRARIEDLIRPQPAWSGQESHPPADAAANPATAN